MIGKDLNRETNIVSLFQRHRPGGGRLVGELAPPHPGAPASWEEHRWPCHHQGQHLWSQDCRNWHLWMCSNKDEGWIFFANVECFPENPHVICETWRIRNCWSCNGFRFDSMRWMWKWRMQNKQTRHRWSHLSMASYSSVLTWCLSYQSTLWPHFPSCGNNWNYWNCCMYFFNRGDQAGHKFQVFWKIATCQFWWGVIKPD